MARRRSPKPEVVPLSTEHDLSTFDCGEASLNSWLVSYALHNQANGYTRTFVVTEPGGVRVVGYYSLATGMITRADAPKKVAGHKSPPDIPIALLARLAVDVEFQRQGLSRILLRNAFMNAASASQLVAFRAVVVDALDERRAEFYKRFGFIPTRIHPLKLILPMQDIIASLDAACG